MVDELPIRARWAVVEQEMDERGRRMWAAAEAMSAGRGGIVAVARATGISQSTVRRGIAEARSGERAAAGRVRRAGAGRRRIAEREPGLAGALEELIDGATLGDPMSPLRWTSRSAAKLALALDQEGVAVSQSTVERQLKASGYSLQANRKTLQGSEHPDRDGQFQHIAQVCGQALAAREPVISVDTKKKELIGQYKNPGREWRPTGDPVLVGDHDFPDKDLGKVVPDWIYDV